jgi:pimeloyl-ACP methyl ester carboxylesterase
MEGLHIHTVMTNIFSSQCLMIVPKIAVIVSMLFLLSCSTRTTLNIKKYMFDSAQRQKTLVIYLPGHGGSMEDLEREGILAALRTQGAPVDVVAVDAVLQFYMDRTLLPRIDTELMPKIKADGYSTIWMIGTSMGGLGSLLYASTHPGAIKGIILLGPFLGDEPIIREISGAGGLLTWTPADTLSDNYERDLWLYLKKCVQDTSGVYPRLFLLTGRDDRYHAAHQLLAPAMDPSHVFWSEGGHDWDTWRSSFAEFARQSKPDSLFMSP